MNKTIVIYHKSDFDGIFCREIARRKFKDSADYIGWEYGEPEPVIPAEVESLYMLDISVAGLMNDPRLTWIDHHKSAIEKYGVREGIQLDGVAACRLTWQWFYGPEFLGPDPKKEFIDRKVDEPLAVRLAGEYDVWDNRDPRAKLFQHGLRSRELTEGDWSLLVSSGEIPTANQVEALEDLGYSKEDFIECDGTFTPAIVHGLLDAGKTIQYFQTKRNASIIKSIGFTVQFEGLCLLACNAARYNSFLFTEGLKPEHEGLLGFKWTGYDWSISLYGVPGKPDIDLSKIAVKFGGGGHKQACGFRVPASGPGLPFVQSSGLLL